MPACRCRRSPPSPDLRLPTTGAPTIVNVKQWRMLTTLPLKEHRPRAPTASLILMKKLYHPLPMESPLTRQRGAEMWTWPLSAHIDGGGVAGVCAKGNESLLTLCVGCGLMWTRWKLGGKGNPAHKMVSLQMRLELPWRWQDFCHDNWQNRLPDLSISFSILWCHYSRGKRANCFLQTRHDNFHMILEYPVTWCSGVFHHDKSDALCPKENLKTSFITDSTWSQGRWICC